MAMNPDFTKLNLEEHPHCSYDEWKAELEKTTGKNYDALYENTMERIPVGPLYGKDVYDQCNHLDYMSGIPPFLRGPYSTMYVFRPWTVRQYAGFSTAEESNAFYRRNLAAGQKGPLRRHSAGPDVRIHDDERCRSSDSGILHQCRYRTGRRQEDSGRHDPE